MTDTVTWSSYEFVVYPAEGTRWNDVPGVYIFCGVTQKNQWKACYVGQAESFRDRFSSHEKWGEAVQLGATHVHARVVQQAASRDTIESELIQAYQPPLNNQLQ